MHQLILLGLAFTIPLGFAQAKPAVHTVKIEGMKFTEDPLTVHQGDTVVWENKDIVPHTATGTHHEFDSKEIKPGSSWKYVAKKKGEISYVCSFHPTMKAQLIVK
jgi:plastocyanin